jgi:hypothetical protein
MPLKYTWSGYTAPGIFNLGTAVLSMVRSKPRALYPWANRPPCQIKGRLAWPESSSRSFGEDKNPLPLPATEFWFLWCQALSLVTTPTGAGTYWHSVFIHTLIFPNGNTVPLRQHTTKYIPAPIWQQTSNNLITSSSGQLLSTAVQHNSPITCQIHL